MAPVVVCAVPVCEAVLGVWRSVPWKNGRLIDFQPAPAYGGGNPLTQRLCSFHLARRQSSVALP